MVGAIGFEPTTLCSQSRCATRLRYAPTEGVVQERPVWRKTKKQGHAPKGLASPLELVSDTHMHPPIPIPLKRFFIQAPLTVGITLPLPDALQHRLRSVLRHAEGAVFHVFNGQDGLFEAVLADAKARHAKITAPISPYTPLPRLALWIGLPKKDAWETVLRQATEMGVTDIFPLKTAFSQVDKIANPARVQLLLAEAAEQSERLDIPTLHDIQPLSILQTELHTPLMWAFERHGAVSSPKTAIAPALLVGPEGGFSASEVEMLLACPHIVPMSLGTTILRTDTAVVAGLSRIKQI